MVFWPGDNTKTPIPYDSGIPKLILIVVLSLTALPFAQAFPTRKFIGNGNASIEAVRKGDSTYFHIATDEQVVLSPECGEWELYPDSIFNSTWARADYPGYTGCYETSSPLSSAYYAFEPMSLRRYIERLYYPITIEPYNAETLMIFRKEFNDSVIIRSKEEFQEFERAFPRVKYFSSYGSGTADPLISRFANGIHEFTVSFKVDCSFSTKIPDSDQRCEPDHSRVWWAGEVTQKFRVTKTDSTYSIMKSFSAD